MSDRIGDAWLAYCERLGVATVDLRPTFRESTVRLFWTTDVHIDLAGQRVVAQALLSQISAD